MAEPPTDDSQGVEETKSSTAHTRNLGYVRIWRALVAVALVAIAVAIPLLFVPNSVRWWQARRDAAELAARGEPPQPAIVFPHQPGQPIKIFQDRWNDIGLQVSSITPTAIPKPLVLDGVLYLDPDDYGLVRSRFEGEVVEIAKVAAKDPAELTAKDSSLTRPLRFGDEVKKGQVLAVVWSRELGEKKSEYAETLSELAFDRETLQKRSSVEGAVAQSTIREAERRVKQGEIAADRIEKTLRSWQLSSSEIGAIRTEVQSDPNGTLKSDKKLSSSTDASVDRWARVEIHSPIDGTIVEKNVTVGAIVDTSTSLFKIANLDHLDIRALAYEEDLVALQGLPPEARRWTIQLKGNATQHPLTGSFDRIGNVIDPVQHTGLVMGKIDNTRRELRSGQFVSCSINLPDRDQLMSIPSTSVVDLDGHSTILVQSPGNPELFSPVEVKVARFQDDMACIAPQAVGCPVCLTPQSRVVATGAVEVLSAYREHTLTTGKNL